MAMQSTLADVTVATAGVRSVASVATNGCGPTVPPSDFNPMLNQYSPMTPTALFHSRAPAFLQPCWPASLPSSSHCSRPLMVGYESGLVGSAVENIPSPIHGIFALSKTGKMLVLPTTLNPPTT